MALLWFGLVCSPSQLLVLRHNYSPIQVPAAVGVFVGALTVGDDARTALAAFTGRKELTARTPVTLAADPFWNFTVFVSIDLKRPVKAGHE